MTGPARRERSADCARCFGLCCVAPAFAVSADFAIAKGAGQPCPSLTGEFRCAIHDRLRSAGFPGCAAYDCSGAGQRVSQEIYAGRDWRAVPESAARMFAVFGVVRRLHELAWHLEQALDLAASDPVRAELERELAETDRLAAGSPADIAGLDLGAHWAKANDLLLRASALARATGAMPAEPDSRGADLAGQSSRGADLAGRDLRGADLAGRDLRGADLAGRDLRGADLSRSSLRGACLIAADLRGADLRLADFTGADLRGADLGGADLSTAIFVAPAQLSRGTGDLATRLPPGLDRPSHWA